MKKKEKQDFTKTLNCLHCNNRAPAEIIYKYSRVLETIEEYPGVIMEMQRHYSLLKCPACNELTFRFYDWADWYDDEEASYEILYPNNALNFIPQGLPPAIHKSYEAALKVKNIDVNAYAVLLGRVLEMVCIDRGAKGGNLSIQLKNLSDKNEIPAKLVDLASKLRHFRNIGAHVGTAEITTDDVPILTDLIGAILAYVYTAPYLASAAEEKYLKLKNR